MINRINSISTDYKPTFKSIKPKYILLPSEAYKQASSLRTMFKDILTTVNYNTSLINYLKENISGLKLTEKTLTYINENSQGIKLSLPRGFNGNIFTMQLLNKEEKPKSIIINDANRLLESFSLTNETYLSEKDYNPKEFSSLIDEIYNLADFPILKIRLNIKKFSKTQETFLPNGMKVNPNNFIGLEFGIGKSALGENFTGNFNKGLDPIDPINLDELVEVTKEENSKNSFLPKTDWNDYSMAEIIKQNPTQKPSARKRVKEYQVTKPSTNSWIEELRERRQEIKHRAESQKTTVVKETKPQNPIEIKETKPEKKKVVLKPKREYVKKSDLSKASDGIVNIELEEKLKKIIALYQKIVDDTKKVANKTRAKIYDSYENFEKYRNGFETSDFEVRFIKNRKYKDKDFLNIIDKKSGESIQFMDNKKVVANKINWNKIKSLPNLKFLSEKDMYSKMESININTLTDNILAKLENLKTYIETKAWRIPYKKPVDESKFWELDDLSFQNLNSVKTIYQNIKKEFEKFHPVNVTKIKKAYGKLQLAKSSRIEFINPVKDDTNLVFDILKNSHGIFYKIAKVDKNNKVNQAFLINEKGNLVKNIQIGKEIKDIMPNFQLKTKYFTPEEITNETLVELNSMLNILEENLKDYENFILKYSNSPKKSNKNEQIDFNKVKEFLDKTVNEIQTSADKLREITGFKSALDSVAESLRYKFDEFLNKFKKN